MINDELISRKEVIDRLQKAQNVFLKKSPLEVCGISYAREIIASEVEIPTIEKRPQGEWIIVKDERYGDNVKCPFCEKELAGTDLNFCCKCGAELTGSEKMNGGAV